MIDTIIIAGILISGGFMALLPIVKDPLNRDKKTKLLIGKFNWVAYTIIGLFIVSVLLGLWKESRDREDKKREIQDNRKELSDHFEKVISNTSNEFSETRKTIIDSMNSIYNKEGERQRGQFESAEAKHKRQMDSLEASKQRELTKTDKIRLIKIINDVIKAKNLPANVPIAIAAPLGDNEATIYAKEIVTFLKSKEFNVVALSNSSTHDIVGAYIRNIDQFLVFYSEQDSFMSIHVGVLGNRP